MELITVTKPKKAAAKGRTPKSPRTSDNRAGAKEHRGSNQTKHPQPLPKPSAEVLSGLIPPIVLDQALVQAALADELKFPDFVAVDKVDPRQYKPNEKDRTLVAFGRAGLLTGEQIAGVVGVSRATLYKYYAEELAVGMHSVTTRVLGNLAVNATQTADRKAAVSAAKVWLENIAGLNKSAPGGDKQSDAIKNAGGTVSAQAGIITPDGVLTVRVNIGAPPGLLADL